jgi:hypothetical protein
MRQYYASRRNRRCRNDSHIHRPCLDSTQLQKWGGMAESSQVLIQGSFRDRHVVRDFAIDMIDLISDASVPVVWALDPNHKPDTAFTLVDVLKYMASQILQLNHTMLNERSVSLSAARFQSTTAEAGWFSLLGSVLEGLQQIYIVIDLELLNRSVTSETSWLAEFPRLFKSLVARNIRTLVKVAFINPLGVQRDDGHVQAPGATIKITSRTSGRIQKPVRGQRTGKRAAAQPTDQIQSIKYAKNLFQSNKFKILDLK